MSRLALYLVTLALFFAYHPIIYDLRDQVLGSELAHHAPLVLALMGLIIYQRWEHLKHLWASPGEKDNGVWMVVGLIGNVMGQFTGVYYLSQLSLPLCLYGTVRFLMGRDLAQALITPLAFSVLSFPIPGKVYLALASPLKLFVTQRAGEILHLMGYPVHIMGNIIELPSLLLGVEDACSGLNSLLAMTTLTIFSWFFMLRRPLSRVVSLLAIVPAVIMANIVRVTLSTMGAIHWGEKVLEGWFHIAWGLLVFMIAFLVLLIVEIMLRKWEGEEHGIGK